MVAILIIAHGKLGESLIHCASHVLGSKPQRCKPERRITFNRLRPVYEKKFMKGDFFLDLIFGVWY